MNPIGIISMQHARPFAAHHFAQLARWKSAGFNFVELLVPEKGELNLPALRNALNDNDLKVVLTARINPERDLTHNDAAVRRAAQSYLRECIDMAIELGADTVSGPLYGSPLVFAARAPHPIREAERALRELWCVEGLTLAGAYAQEHGVRLAVEPLNRFETDFLNTTRQGLALMRMVDLPSVGLTLDTFHMNMEDDDIASALRSVGRHLFHFQANENHRGYLGTGHIDWTSVVRALADIGYESTITLEPFRRTDERLSIPFAQWKAPKTDEQAELAACCSFIKNLIELNRGRK